VRRMPARDRLVVTLFAAGIVLLIVGLAFLAGYVLGRIIL
jgi:hypothetical protein